MNRLYRIVKYLLPIIFVVFYVETTVLWHSHIVDDIVISHSHPYSNTTGGHSHSSNEIQVISHLSSFIAMLSIGIVLPALFMLRRFLHFFNRRVALVYSALLHPQLRAPPVFC